MHIKPHKKKCVVFVLPSLCVGGAERVMITLANNLNRTKYDVHFVVLSDGPIRSWLDPRIPVHVVGAQRVRFGLVGLFLKLKRIRPDVMVSSIIHTNTALLLMKPFFLGTRLIIRESSLPTALIRKYGVKGRFSKVIYKLLYQFADTVISPSSVIVEQFRKKLKLNMANHKILFNPVDSEKIQSKIADSFTPAPSRAQTVHFICTGRLTFEKGFDRLIEGLQNFNMHPFEWRLDILGEGEERKNIEARIAEYGLEKHVFLQGYIDNPWDVIAQADCLLLPSLWEGLPNVVLESLLCGTPVIAMRQAGGIVDIQKVAAPDSVKTAETIADLLVLMQTVKPKAKTEKSDSLLPDIFLLPNIMREFEEVIEGDSYAKTEANCLTNKEAASGPLV